MNPNFQQQAQQFNNQGNSLMNQYNQMGVAPNYQQKIADEYNNPVLKPLTQENANLQSQYLPSIFQPFTQMGTGAGDMSAAAKLSSLGSSLGRLTGQIGANQQVQGFYGDQINNVAKTLTDQFNQGKSDLFNQGQTYLNQGNQATSNWFSQQNLAMQQQQAAQQSALFTQQQKSNAQMQAYMRSLGQSAAPVPFNPSGAMGGAFAGIQHNPGSSSPANVPANTFDAMNGLGAFKNYALSLENQYGGKGTQRAFNPGAIHGGFQALSDFLGGNIPQSYYSQPQ